MFEVPLLLDLLIDLAHDRKGATAVEYSLIAVFISIAAIVAMESLGLALQDLFRHVSSVLEYGLDKVGL